MSRPARISPQSSPGKVRLFAQAGLSIGIIGGCLLAAPMKVMAGVGDTVVFTYGLSISDPPAGNTQLGIPPWATVTLTEQAGGQFWMDIATSFNPTDGSDPSLTQLVFNLNTDYSSVANPFTLVSPFCTPNSPSTQTTCDGSISLSYDLDNEGITGSGQPQGGYDLLVQLPPPGVKLDQGQSPIRLYIQGPNLMNSTFSVVDFFGGVSTEDGYETAAKIQELIADPEGCEGDACFLPGSTVITGTGTNNGGGEPEENPVPGPLPLLGAAAAFGFSRKLRLRIAAERKRTSYTL